MSAQTTPARTTPDATTAQINLIVADAFANATPPRSAAYVEGFRCAIRRRLAGTRLPVPYRLGSAEADAFFSGRDDGDEHPLEVPAP